MCMRTQGGCWVRLELLVADSCKLKHAKNRIFPDPGRVFQTSSAWVLDLLRHVRTLSKGAFEQCVANVYTHICTQVIEVFGSNFSSMIQRKLEMAEKAAAAERGDFDDEE